MEAVTVPLEIQDGSFMWYTGTSKRALDFTTGFVEHKKEIIAYCSAHSERGPWDSVFSVVCDLLSNRQGSEVSKLICMK